MPKAWESSLPSHILRVLDAFAPPDVVHAHSAVFTPVVQAFRFYEDGTESGSTPRANQDTNVSVNVSAGNVIVHLRVRIQETGGGAGATTDDYTLQFSKNGGAYSSVGAATSNVQAGPSANVTDQAATTNRATNGITDGTGSFVATKLDEADGIVTDTQITASNFTEMLWSITLVKADLADADTLDFRVSLNGGTPGMTNSVTPRITVSIPAPVDSFGTETIGGTLWTPGDRMIGAKKALTGTITVNRVYCYCAKTGGGNANTTAVIYTDSGGPAVLEGESDVLVLSTTLGWQEFVFSTPVSLTPGDFWLGIFRQDAGVDAYYDAGGANTSFFASPTFPGAPDPLGTETLESKNLSIYAAEVTAPTGTIASTLDELRASLNAVMLAGPRIQSTLDEVRASLNATAVSNITETIDSDIDEVAASLSAQHRHTAEVDALLDELAASINAVQRYPATIVSLLDELRASLNATMFPSTTIDSDIDEVQASLNATHTTNDPVTTIDSDIDEVQAAITLAQQVLLSIVSELSEVAFSGVFAMLPAGTVQTALDEALISLNAVTYSPVTVQSTLDEVTISLTIGQSQLVTVDSDLDEVSGSFGVNTYNAIAIAVLLEGVSLALQTFAEVVEVGTGAGVDVVGAWHPLDVTPSRTLDTGFRPLEGPGARPLSQGYRPL